MGTIRSILPINEFRALVAFSSLFMARVTFSGRMQRMTSSPGKASPTASMSVPLTLTMRVPRRFSRTRPVRTVSVPTKEATNSSAGRFMTMAGLSIWAIRPPSMTAMRSERRRASFRSWVAMIVVIFVSARTFSRSVTMASRVGGSSDCEGLVEKEDLRRDGEGPGKARPLGFPAGKSFCGPVAQVRDAETLQLCLHDAPGLGTVYAADLEPRYDVAENGRVEEQRLLEDHGEPAPVFQYALLCTHRLPPEEDLSRRGFHQVGQGLQERRLSRAVGADERKGLSLEDLHAGDIDQQASPADHFQVFRFEDLCHLGLSLCWT